MRYGIGEPTQYSLEEIGARFFLTRERIRQVKSRHFENCSTTVSICKPWSENTYNKLLIQKACLDYFNDELFATHIVVRPPGAKAPRVVAQVFSL